MLNPVGRVLLGAAIIAGIVAARFSFASSPAATEALAAIASLAAVSLWATGLLPHAYTALLYLVTVVALNLAPAAQVAAGFTSGIFWLVASGMVIGVSIKHTGLGDRIAGALSGRNEQSYLVILAGIALSAGILSFLMPSSMGRTLTVVPIILALADRLGFAPGSKGRAGMVMVAATTLFIPSGAILTGLMPSMLLAGSAEALYGIDLTYGAFLLTHYPVMGLLRGIVIVLLAAWLFADQPQGRLEELSDAPAVGRNERILSAILAGALALWFTDYWHGIAPYWIALGAALILLTGGRALLPRDVLTRKMDYGALLYVVAVLVMGSVVSDSGLAATIGSWLTERLPLDPERSFSSMYVLSLIAAFSGLFVTNPGVPVVLTPLATEFSAASGLPIATVLMTQVVGYSNVILPYQGSPILVAMALGGVRLWDGTKLVLAITVVTLCGLLPLEIFLWRALGLA